MSVESISSVIPLFLSLLCFSTTVLPALVFSGYCLAGNADILLLLLKLQLHFLSQCYAYKKANTDTVNKLYKRCYLYIFRFSSAHVKKHIPAVRSELR